MQYVPPILLAPAESTESPYLLVPHCFDSVHVGLFFGLSNACHKLSTCPQSLHSYCGLSVVFVT